MSFPVEDAVVRDIAKDLVGQIAPAELVAYEALSRAYFADPERALRGDAGDDPLRFGDAALALLLTPLILAVTTEVTRYVCAEVLGPALSRGGPAVVGAVRRLLRGRTAMGGPAQPAETQPQAEAEVALTEAQWERVREIVADTTRRAGVSADTARLISDAVVGTSRDGSTQS